MMLIGRRREGVRFGKRISEAKRLSIVFKKVLLVISNGVESVKCVGRCNALE